MDRDNDDAKTAKTAKTTAFLQIKSTKNAERGEEGAIKYRKAECSADTNYSIKLHTYLSMEPGTKAEWNVRYENGLTWIAVRNMEFRWGCNCTF